MVQAEVSDAGGVDEWNDLGEIEGCLCICRTSEAPFADWMNILDGDGESVNLDVGTAGFDVWRVAAARICWLFRLVESRVRWP